MYDCAITLIKKGKAYVDSLDMETMREYRGTVTEPGKESPYRDRSIDENLELFEAMRAGEFDEGEHVLRAKIDMSASNMLMRDPLLYRIRYATHHNTGDKWCIYPMYDYAHCLEDAFEDVTHSLCTLEFENNRAIYDWVIEHTEVDHQPQQIEFARRNLSYTITSKRRLGRLIDNDIVGGWDDPRLPTIAGLRRRGVPPSAIREFCRRLGVSKAENRAEFSQFEDTIRDDLNMKAPRVMGVVDPLKVVITNYPEDDTEWLDAPYYPHDVPKEGSRQVPFGRHLWIDREDFSEDPPSSWYRLAPGAEVRLRYAYNMTCDDVVKNDDGDIVELRCSYDQSAKSGEGTEGPDVEGIIHWVHADEAIPAEIRQYERLFNVEDPDGDPETDFIEHINDDSLVKTDGFVEPSIADDDEALRYQFERRGYFRQDPVDSTDDNPVFNRIVSLRDRWAEKQKAKKKREDERRRRENERRRQKALKAQQEAGPSDPISQKRQQARDENPELAKSFERYRDDYGLDRGDADLLSGHETTAAFFDDALQTYDNPSTIAPWLVNEVLARLDDDQHIDTLHIGPAEVATIVEMIDGDNISSQAAIEVLDAVLESDRSPETVVEEEGLQKVADTSALEPVIDDIIDDHPDEVERYRDGNQRLIGFFIGQVMQATGGAADAPKVREMLQEKLAAS